MPLPRLLARGTAGQQAGDFLRWYILEGHPGHPKVIQVGLGWLCSHCVVGHYSMHAEASAWASATTLENLPQRLAMSHDTWQDKPLAATSNVIIVLASVDADRMHLCACFAGRP